MTGQPRTYRKALPLVLLFVAGGLTQGCAALALPVLETVVGLGASTGTTLTLDGIVYRTFAEPLDPVRKATLMSLERMGVTQRTEEASSEGRAIVGNAGDRTVYVDLEKVTSKATRMRVTVKQRYVFRDRATSSEIIAQTEQALENIRAGAPSQLSGIAQFVDNPSPQSTAIQTPQTEVVKNSRPSGFTSWFTSLIQQSGRDQTWR